MLELDIYQKLADANIFPLDADNIPQIYLNAPPERMDPTTTFFAGLQIDDQSYTIDRRGQIYMSAYQVQVDIFGSSSTIVGQACDDVVALFRREYGDGSLGGTRLQKLDENIWQVSVSFRCWR